MASFVPLDGLCCSHYMIYGGITSVPTKSRAEKRKGRHSERAKCMYQCMNLRVCHVRFCVFVNEDSVQSTRKRFEARYDFPEEGETVRYTTGCQYSSPTNMVAQKGEGPAAIGNRPIVAVREPLTRFQKSTRASSMT